jgi:hypothetical protein
VRFSARFIGIISYNSGIWGLLTLRRVKSIVSSRALRYTRLSINSAIEFEQRVARDKAVHPQSRLRANKAQYSCDEVWCSPAALPLLTNSWQEFLFSGCLCEMAVSNHSSKMVEAVVFEFINRSIQPLLV